jgi:hypothetical protein
LAEGYFFLLLPYAKIGFGAGDFQFRLDDLKLGDCAGLVPLLSNLPEPLGEFQNLATPVGFGARKRYRIVSRANIPAHLPSHSRNVQIRQQAFLPRHFNAALALGTQFQRLIEEQALVRLVTQGGEGDAWIGPLLRDANTRQSYCPLLAGGSQVEVLLFREVERSLQGEPRWLLRTRGRNPDEQNYNQPSH